MELKQCPNCGRDGKIYRRKSCTYLGKFFAVCKNVSCPTCTSYVGTEEGAILAWNGGDICPITATDAEIDNLKKAASRAMRVRIREGLLTGKWVHYFDKGVLDFTVQDKDVPRIKVAYTEKIEDAAYIAAAKPTTILALIRELRACRAKLAEYEQQGSLHNKMAEFDIRTN